MAVAKNHTHSRLKYSQENRLVQYRLLGDNENKISIYEIGRNKKL